MHMLIHGRVINHGPRRGERIIHHHHHHPFMKTCVCSWVVVGANLRLLGSPTVAAHVTPCAVVKHLYAAAAISVRVGESYNVCNLRFRV